MLHLPKKHQLLYNSIAKGEVQAFLLPLDNDRIEAAARKGFGTLRFVRKSPPRCSPDVLCAAAFKDEVGEGFLPADVVEGERFVTIQELCRLGLEPVSCTVGQLSELYDDLFPTLDFREKLRQIKCDGEFKETGLAPSVLNPVRVCVIETGMCPVRETSREWMRDEGVRVIHHVLKGYEDESLYFKGRVDEEGNEFYVYVSDDFNGPDCSAPTPELAYEKFVRAIYGDKVWEENRTVVHLKVVPYLKESYIRLADFKRFGRNTTYRMLHLSTVMDPDELSTFVLAQTDKDANDRNRQCVDCHISRFSFKDGCDFRAGKDSAFWNDPFFCPQFKFKPYRP